MKENLGQTRKGVLIGIFEAHVLWPLILVDHFRYASYVVADIEAH